jgi:hypothetical protein
MQNPEGVGLSADQGNMGGTGVCRIYREAVRELSPGFQPWVHVARNGHPEGVSD